MLIIIAARMMHRIAHCLQTLTEKKPGSQRERRVTAHATRRWDRAAHSGRYGLKPFYCDIKSSYLKSARARQSTPNSTPCSPPLEAGSWHCQGARRRGGVHVHHPTSYLTCVSRNGAQTARHALTIAARVVAVDHATQIRNACSQRKCHN
jgi:hypothetical protein